MVQRLPLVWVATYAALRQHEQYGEGPNYGISLVEGDIITMNIDLDALFLSFNINNKDYGKAFNIKKIKYRAAISFCSKGSSIELLSAA